MKQANLNDVLKGLQSSKVTERRDAFTSFKIIFDRPNFVDNFHLDKNGKVEPLTWVGVFQALFKAVLVEKAAVTKKETGKSAGTSAAAQRRLEDAAGTVRWLTERTAHLMTRRATKPIFQHLLQAIVHQRQLLSPVALHYIKALRCLVGYTQHLEHLDDDVWVQMVEMGFNCLLEDPIKSSFEDEVELKSPQAADDSVLYEDDELSDDDTLPSTSRKRSRGPQTQTQSQKASKRARTALHSVSREQVEFMSLVSVLLGSSSSPILSPKYPYLSSAILTRFQRFLGRYTGDTSLLHDYIIALSSTLSHLSLNKTLDVAKFACGSWDALLGLWGTKNKRIKEGLVSIFRTLIPFATSENEMYRVAGGSFDRAEGLRRLSLALNGEADSRWGVGGLSLDCLRLEMDISHQDNSAFITKAFRYGWGFDSNQALAWAVLELHSDCIAKDQITEVLLSLVSVDDGVIQSWVFVCFAAIASTVNSSSGVLDTRWGDIWQLAVRRANVSTVSRAACHAAYAILSHTRAHAQLKDSAHIPLASNRVLFEIETLAKDLDVQGPPFPYDSVCAFLAACLRVASQDMHLYRMQLEEKVLSWLIDCWQVAGFRNKSLSLHMVHDILALLESICGFSKSTDFAARIPLPEGQIVESLVEEAKTRVIRDYVLAAQLPQFRPKEDIDVLVQPHTASASDPSGRPPAPRRGRERRIAGFFQKNLENLQTQWDENSAHPTAETARLSLDMAVTALCFESVLALNGMQSERGLIRCACKLVLTVAALLPDPRWTATERALICLGLDPLTMIEDNTNDGLAWDAMPPPDIGSGIQSLLLSRLSTHSDDEKHSLLRSRLDFLRVVWQNPEIQSAFSSVVATMRDVLRISLGEKPTSAAHDLGDEHDGFGPIRMATDQHPVNKDEPTVDLLQSRYTIDVSISFLTVGPSLQSNSGEPTRDKQLVDDVSRCAKSRPEAFLSVLPIVLSKTRQGLLSLSIPNLDILLTSLADVLTLFRYSRSSRSQSVVIQFLASTLGLWASANFAMGNTLDKIRGLCHWLSKALRKRKLRSWVVRDLFARFVDQYLIQDPTEQAWGLPEAKEDSASAEDWSPSSLLPEMGHDDDLRVRFRAAVLNARLFAFARRTEPRRITNDVYLVIKNNLTNVLEHYEDMLTRILSLGNTMVVASATRRGAYWHLLEACLHTPQYSAHIEAVLRGVSQRLGLIKFSSLFENYASQLAFSLRQENEDFIRFPPHLLGYQDRKQCVAANFRSFAPTNIWTGGQRAFENHCKLVTLTFHEGFRDCFGSLMGYRVVDWIDKNHTVDDTLLQSLKSTQFPEEDFDWCLRQNVDSIVASILGSLGDLDLQPIITALSDDDPSGNNAEVFKHLTRYRQNGAETHRPNLPAFPAETILRALCWLRSQGPNMDEKATSYHVIHQLLANVDSSPLVNEQFRFINAICLWVATHSRDFDELSLLHTLIHGATALLGQSDLTRSAQSILDWAFKRYRKTRTKHLHIPELLVRIACIANDFSQTTHNPTLAVLGTDLLQWIDDQAFELSKIPSLSEQVLSNALPAWPHQPSPKLAPLFDSITGQHLSDALKDSRIFSSKFRLVRRLREHALSNRFSKDNFAKADFWRLKESIPSSDQLQDADVEAFATLLYLSKGQLESFRNASLGTTSTSDAPLDLWADGVDASREPIVLILLVMLQRELPSQSHAAYETLRLIKSVETEQSSFVQISSSEHQKELEYLGNFQRTPIRRTPRNVGDLVSCQSYLDSVNDFSRWVVDVTTLLSDVLSSGDAFYAQMIPMLQKDTEFAEQVLPNLVHIILFKERSRGKPAFECRDAITRFFTSVLSEELSDVRCLRSVISVVLHLRQYDRDKPPPPPPKGKQPKNRPRIPISVYNALSYNKWLTIDFSLLARCSTICGAYTTALLFLELSAEDDVGPSSTSNDILYEIYRHIDEPDGFYGIHDADLHQNLIKRFHHENQWERAFRFHGAALEAGDNTGHAEGLVKSFHSFGFDHLANDTLRAPLTSRGNQIDNPPHDMSYRLAWRTETWDLPESVGYSSGASLYLALRAIHRERDDQNIDHTIRRCLHTEMDHLRSLGLENFTEIRDVIQDVMCLREIVNWRQNSIQLSLEMKDLTDRSWNEFSNTEPGFDFPILENILATRVSLVRSVRRKEQRVGSGPLSPFHQRLIDIETQCLVQLSEAARAVNEVQVALNSIVRAVGLDKLPSLGAFEGFASVLWSQKEEKTAVEYLDRLRLAGWGSYVRDVIEDDRKALILAQLGSWSSAACLKKPEDIQTDYFSVATAILDSANLSNILDAHSTHAKVYHQCAIFAERQYFDAIKSPDAIRWKLYVERKQREIESRSQEIQRANEKKLRESLQRHQNTATKLLAADVESFRRHNSARDSFLEQAIDMYSRCLEVSDAHDQDAPIRLCSLWFANFEDDRETFHSIVQNALTRVPSRKFVFLSHQISARISKSAAEPSAARASLQCLVLRMCKEHPFHILYQLYCSQPKIKEPNIKQSEDPPTPAQAERAAAAADVFNILRKDPTVKQRLLDMEHLSSACTNWAHAPDLKLTAEWMLGRISNIRVPVITHHTPVDPSMRYLDCPWIDKYEARWINAGGINMVKLGICHGTDGVKYKQLFKGRGQDDLRQDAVMEQVFDLVNGILGRDRETRRRLLNVRDYKVVPLDIQAGVLEFVENTQPLKDLLGTAHERYHPSEPDSTDISVGIKAIRTKNITVSLRREKLIQNYAHIEKTVKPVMRHFFTEKHKTPNAWFATRLDYSRSVATSSIVGHILGLGDRHISNILIDKESGQVVPIDLGIAFDQGKLLPVPELVPFRLTRDIVDGFGISGTAGVFQRCAEETLRVLRDDSEIIMTVLEVFKHDPLHSWTASETKIQQVQEGTSAVTTTTTARIGVDIGIDMSSGTAEEAADRALNSVFRKLDKSLSVQTVISQLIREATDPVNHALMFEEKLYTEMPAM
ncbi:hypothetical protein DXG01_002297 [Tephrocybe rancida]|nr:hypothetical protein DXG01_002297 [Tephrocybe rancida]